MDLAIFYRNTHRIAYKVKSRVDCYIGRSKSKNHSKQILSKYRKLNRSSRTSTMCNTMNEASVFKAFWNLQVSKIQRVPNSVGCHSGNPWNSTDDVFFLWKPHIRNQQRMNIRLSYRVSSFYKDNAKQMHDCHGKCATYILCRLEVLVYCHLKKWKC